MIVSTPNRVSLVGRGDSVGCGLPATVFNPRSSSLAKRITGWRLSSSPRLGSLLCLQRTGPDASCIASLRQATAAQSIRRLPRKKTLWSCFTTALVIRPGEPACQ